MTSPTRLCGWSLLSAFAGESSVEASLQGVAAAAGTLTMTGFLTLSSVTVTPAAAWPAGANVVTVNNVTGGPVIAEIEGGTETPVTITFNPPASVTGTPTAVVPAIVGGPAYTIDASGQNTLTLGVGSATSGAIMDGGQQVALFSFTGGGDSTRWLTEEGIYVGTALSFTMFTGIVSGVIWVVDNWHGGDN